jgi:hypothetical protein
VGRHLVVVGMPKLVVVVSLSLQFENSTFLSICETSDAKGALYFFAEHG